MRCLPAEKRLELVTKSSARLDLCSRLRGVALEIPTRKYSSARLSIERSDLFDAVIHVFLPVIFEVTTMFSLQTPIPLVMTPPAKTHNPSMNNIRGGNDSATWNTFRVGTPLSSFLLRPILKLVSLSKQTPTISKYSPTRTSTSTLIHYR